MTALSATLKRAFDMFAATLGIVLLLPILFVVGLLIRFTSSGPVLFVQERVGRSGRHFRLLKFRTMRSGAAGSAITIGQDSRITAVGHVLRRLKLDELPQLLNVLVGSMSIVGPRPEVQRYVDLYPADQRDLVLSVRPGITDLASLVFIDESRLLGRAADPERFYVEVLIPAKLELAEAYVRCRSWWLDLRILTATLTGIFGWRWMPAPWSREMRADGSTPEGAARLRPD